MESRYRIENKTHFVEMPRSIAGRLFLEKFRQTHPEFKRRRVRDIVQACPSKVRIGEIYELM